MRFLPSTRLMTLCAATLCAAAMLAAPAAAKKKGGVYMPDSLTIEGKALKLNGMGIREATVFNVDVYVAGLYVENPSKSAKELLASTEVKRLHLKFVRDVEKDDMTGAFDEGFEKQKVKGKFASELKQLNGWMADVDDGDHMVFTFVPGKGVAVKVKGSDKGTIANDDFGKALLAVWLGRNPPNSGLKKGLLGR